MVLYMYKNENKFVEKKITEEITTIVITTNNLTQSFP